MSHRTVLDYRVEALRRAGRGGGVLATKKGERALSSISGCRGGTRREKDGLTDGRDQGEKGEDGEGEDAHDGVGRRRGR